MQLPFDFTAIQHIENNPESQAFYDANNIRFNNQCKKVYDLLKSGKRLQVIQSAVDYQIGHLPRRIADLIALGIPVKSERVEGGKKEYFL